MVNRRIVAQNQRLTQPAKDVDRAISDDRHSRRVRVTRFNEPRQPDFSRLANPAAKIFIPPNRPAEAMVTCSKIYHDIPFAHRQHKHAGHCALVHGHNWSFRFTFGADQPDENGFVIDFGRVKFIRKWIEDTFDHACVFNRDDPLREALVATAPDAFKVVVVDSCSCEGLAEFVFDSIDPIVREHTGNRAWLTEVEIFEDSRNSATYRPE